MVWHPSLVLSVHVVVLLQDYQQISGTIRVVLLLLIIVNFFPNIYSTILDSAEVPCIHFHM